MTKAELLTKITLATGLFIIHAGLIAFATTSRIPVEAKFTKYSPVTVSLIADSLAPQKQWLSLPSRMTKDVASLPLQEIQTTHKEKLPESDLKGTETYNEVASATDLLGTYLPSRLMERRPTPISEPDMQMVKATPLSGFPINLRVYVDRLGKVVEVTPLSVHPLDNDFINDVIAMFRATAFLPGQFGGEDVSSYLDIELTTQLDVPMAVPLESPP